MPPPQASQESAVLVVAGRQVERMSLLQLLHCEGLKLLGAAGTVEEAIGLARDRESVVLVLQMRSEAALTALKTLGTELPRSTAIVLGESGDDDHRLAYVEAGAVGYVSAETTPAEIGAAVGAVARGEAVLPPALAHEAVRRLSRPRSRDQPAFRLTGREQQIMRFIIDEGLSDKQIAVRLGRKESSIGSHLRNVFEKLGVHSRTEAAAVVRSRDLLNDELP